MPDFRAPGMAASRGTYIRRAIIATIVTVILAIVVTFLSTLRPDDSFRLKMFTDTLAGGIGQGTGVVVNGSEIGEVESVTADRNGDFVLNLALDKQRLSIPGVISTTTRVTYAPKNLFGIAAVVLTSEPGGEPLRSGSDFRPDTPVDATLTAMLRQLSDMQKKAFEPYVGDLLQKADKATLAFMPVLEIVGKLTGLLVDTEQIPAEVSLPMVAGLVDSLPPAIDNVLGSLDTLLKWPAMRQDKNPAQFLEWERLGINHATTVTIPNAAALLGPKSLGLAMPLMKDILPLLDRILVSSPNARKNGLQIRQLIYNLDRALPMVGGRPVLRAEVVLRGMPGPVAAITGGAR